MAGRGTARRGWARQGMAGVAGRGKVWLAWLGEARYG